MYFIRNLILIVIVSLLNGCIMGSPYGGFIFVGPIDLIKITLESKDERNHSQNEDIIIKNEHLILKSKITIDGKDYKIDKVTYH